jgi:hypothetical protein
LHDGDPEQAKTHVVHHTKGKKAGTSETIHIALGQGLHSAYEDKMVNAHRQEILDGLDKSQKVSADEYIQHGQRAAQATVQLMRNTFKRLPPRDMLNVYLGRKNRENVAKLFWGPFGKATIRVMQDGAHLLAVLWESAWIAGGGEDKSRNTKALKPETAMTICALANFLPSLSIAEIGHVLKRSGDVE